MYSPVYCNIYFVPAAVFYMIFIIKKSQQKHIVPNNKAIKVLFSESLANRSLR